jgi:hypothetical protein
LYFRISESSDKSPHSKIRRLIILRHERFLRFVDNQCVAS